MMIKITIVDFVPTTISTILIVILVFVVVVVVIFISSSSIVIMVITTVIIRIFFFTSLKFDFPVQTAEGLSAQRPQASVSHTGGPICFVVLV